MKHFIYDGSFEGLLTTIFEAYLEKDSFFISKTTNYTANLVDTPYFIETCVEKSERVLTSMTTKLDPKLPNTLYTLYLSDLEGVEIICLNYLKLCYKYGMTINLAKNNDLIIQVDTITRKVRLEAHRFYGFVRFKEIAPLYFYARIEPDHHILPLLSSHFSKRFQDQNFMIHDVKRHMALVYNREDTYIQYFTPEENDKLQNHTFVDTFEDLFQAFYRSTTIPARMNPRLQKRMMPSRYWKHLVECPNP